MKQFCPKCGKWYEISGNICPICRSQLLVPNSNTNHTQTYTQCQQTVQSQQVPNPLPIPKEIKKNQTISGILFSLMFILPMFALILPDTLKLINEDLYTHLLWFYMPFIIICATGGIISLIFGVIFLDKYNKMATVHRRKYQEEYRKYYISQIPDNPLIECPYCHSHKVYKISTSNRVGSVLVAGIASSKIGKQWHCHNCNSDF